MMPNKSLQLTALKRCTGQGGGSATGGDRTERMAVGKAGAGGADRSAGPAVSVVAGADSGIPGRVAGVDLSIGTIHQTIHEASAAVAPAEAELIQAVLDSDLWHTDETSWPEHGHLCQDGLKAEVMFASHYWPRWGNDRIQEVLRGQDRAMRPGSPRHKLAGLRKV